MTRKTQASEIEKSHTAEHLRDTLDDLEHAAETLAMSPRSLMQRGEEIEEEIGQAFLDAEISQAESAVLTKHLADILKPLVKNTAKRNPA